MSEVSKIQLPDNTVVDIKDARIPGVDNVPTSGSDNLVKSGGVYSALLSPSLKHVAYEGFTSSSSYAVHCGVYFKPDDWDKMCSFRFRVHAYVPSQANVESISDITVQCYQGVVKSYYIMNGIADTSNYAYYSLYYYGVTAAGHTAGAQGYFGVYINSANCWSYTTKRQLEYDLIHAEGCTVGLFTTDKNSADARQGYASGNFLSSVKYNTYTAGLQETGDSNTTYSVISNDELRTGTATTGRTVSAARLAANYSITTDSTTGAKTVNIAGVSATIPEEVEANPTVPSGTTPSSLTGLKVGSDYYEVSAGSSDALLYTSQSLTDAQKKQARLNQGLYYPEQVAATTITWNGSTTGLDTLSYYGDTLYKVASSPIDAPLSAYGTVTAHESEDDYTGTLTWRQMTSADGLTAGKASIGTGEVGSIDRVIVVTDGANFGSGVVNDGIYFSLFDDTNYVSSLVINSYIHSDNLIPTRCLEDVATDINKFSNENEIATAKIVYDAIHPKVTSGTAYPNVLCKLGTLSGDIYLSLASIEDATIENEYKITFTEGATVYSVTWPSGITWVGNCLNGNGVPVLSAGSYYEVSIEDGKGVIVEW